MTMKAERQQKESSRVIANNERKNRQLKGFVDNRNKSDVFLHIAQKEARTSQLMMPSNSLHDGAKIAGTKMVYKDLIDGYLPNSPGCIYFTLYKGDELLSSNFSGCIMAAFSFLKPPIGMESLFNGEKFIAHVYCDKKIENDTKFDFYQYEKDGMINIEAMYKPFSGKDEESTAIERRVIEQPGDIPFTGGMRNIGNQWDASTYFQKVNDGKLVKDGEYERISPQDLMRKTGELKRELAKNNKSKCYLTTACVTHKGLSDDCEELTVLRNFRDTYLINKPNGLDLISMYYKEAPNILANIHKRKKEEEDVIMENIYVLIRECVDAILDGDNEFAFRTYCDMVVKLDAEYGQ